MVAYVTFRMDETLRSKRLRTIAYSTGNREYNESNHLENPTNTGRKDKLIII